MTLKERYKNFIDYFRENMPEAETELNYSNPFELVVAVILSAQCTDKRVNIITPMLFERFPDAFSLALADTDEIFKLIKSCSYPNNKAKHLSGMARKLVANFNGNVPSNADELMTLPGVGRKTANVIISVAYRKPAMPVDTHVFRVSGRIGLTRGAKTPHQTEVQLTRHIPQSMLHKAHHWLILHGRYVCKARKPDCMNCGLKDFCRYYLKNVRSESNLN